MSDTAPLFFDFEEDTQSPDDFFKTMFFETCSSTDDSPEDLDSFKEFLVAFMGDGNLEPIRQGFDIVYQNKNVERISIMVNLQCLNQEQKTKALKILANTNKPISSLINVDNVSETIVSLFNGGRETEAFELINKFEVKKIDVSAIEKDTLNYLLRMSLNNFSLIHVFVLLFNSSLEPVELLFNFIEENKDETRLIDYFTTIHSQALKEFIPSIKKHLAKTLPSLKENIDSYELVIKNIGISFKEHDDYKIGYYAVENANQAVLSMLADNNYYTKETLPKIIQSCIKFGKPKLFTYFLNTYGNMLTDELTDKDYGFINFEDVPQLIFDCDFFGVLSFFKENNIVYKDFFNIYLEKLNTFLQQKSFKNTNSLMDLLLHYFIDNKVYLSLLIQENNKYNLNLSLVVDYYFLKDDFDFISTFINSYQPDYRLGYYIDMVANKPLDEKWLNFVYEIIFKSNSQIAFEFFANVCRHRIKQFNFSKNEVVKLSLSNILTTVNQQYSSHVIDKYKYSTFTSDLLREDDSFIENLNMDLIKLLATKRLNLFFGLIYSIQNQNVDSILFFIENMKHQNLKPNRITQYLLIDRLLHISSKNEQAQIIAFETFKTLWNYGFINIKSLTRNLFNLTHSNDGIYKFLIDKNIYKDFDGRNEREESEFTDKVLHLDSFFEKFSYGEIKEDKNTSDVPQTKSQLKLQKETEEDFSFMAKNTKKEKYNFFSRLFSTTLPYYLMFGIVVYLMYFFKLLK